MEFTTIDPRDDPNVGNAILKMHRYYGTSNVKLARDELKSLRIDP
jgi:hypothetical protein